MEELNWLLTEEFLTFSKKIEKIIEEKKAKKVELKAFYDKINLELKALDEEATSVQVEFENFKKSKLEKNNESKES